MTNAVPAGAQAGPPHAIRAPEPAAERSARRKRKQAESRTRRRQASATHRAVTASFTFDDLPAPVARPPASAFVRPNVLDPGDVRAMLASCSTSSRTGLRDRAIIAAGYWGCARLREVVALELDDVDVGAGALIGDRARD